MTKTIFWNIKKYFFFNQNSLLKLFLVPYYEISKYLYAYLMYAIPGVKAVYLQGSFCKKRALLGVSDLDFFVIFNGNKFFLWMCKGLHVILSFNPIIDRVCIPKSEDEYLKFLYTSKTTLYKLLTMEKDSLLLVGNKDSIKKKVQMLNGHFDPYDGLVEFVEYLWASYLKRLIEVNNEELFSINILVKDVIFLKEILESLSIPHRVNTEVLVSKEKITKSMLDLVCDAQDYFSSKETKERLEVNIYSDSTSVKDDFIEKFNSLNKTIIKPFDGEFRDTYVILDFGNVESMIAGIYDINDMNIPEDIYLYYHYRNCLFLLNNRNIYKMENYLSSVSQDPFILNILKERLESREGIYKLDIEIDRAKIKRFSKNELLKFWQDAAYISDLVLMDAKFVTGIIYKTIQLLNLYKGLAENAKPLELYLDENSIRKKCDEATLHLINVIESNLSVKKEKEELLLFRQTITKSLNSVLE